MRMVVKGFLARSMVMALLMAALFAEGGGASGYARGPADNSISDDVPQLAYYYIWFDQHSWDRAKSDLPQLGKYSSDDEQVMRQHVQWAKQAGLDGFIVSWKHTETLDRRLELLIDVAESEDFALSIIYQGLDFDRQPQPVDRVAEDLAFFATTYASRAPFKLFDKPVVIWSGTWEFSREDIERAAAPVRPTLSVLASEKKLDGYERVADVVDGNAYYWSSVNVDTFPGYVTKLLDMSHAVHRRNGLWIAPAAPGFDATLLGGKTVVDRQDGETLTRQLAGANASGPDALGIISWNEFSENSHIEPSQNYGFQYLDILGSYLGVGAPFPDAEPTGADPTDSSASGGGGMRTGLVALPLALAFGGLAFVIVVRRSKRSAGWMPDGVPYVFTSSRSSLAGARARRRRPRKSPVRNPFV